MAVHGRRQGRSLMVTTTGKSYEELPFGPKIMVTHPARAWCPPTDVFECADAYVIKCDISGLHCDEQGRLLDATVSIHGNVISIRGERRDVCTVPRRSALQMEIHYGLFQCQLQIHDAFDAEGVDVVYEDGYLRVVVPKKSPKAPAPRRGPAHS